MAERPAMEARFSVMGKGNDVLAIKIISQKVLDPISLVTRSFLAM